MAENLCLPQVQACRMRVTRLDANGVPTPGAGNMIVTSALINLTLSPVYADADEIEQKNACGDVCINFKGDDSFKRGDITVEVCTPDPYLAAFMSDGTVLTAFDGDRVGYAAPAIGPITGNGVSIEVWAKRIDDGALDIDSPYAWWVMPRIKNLRIGDISHQNGALLPTYTGQALENPNWFDGPLNDWPADSDRVFQWVPTDSLPPAVCGPVTVAAS